jgi:hypothetical protein
LAISKNVLSMFTKVSWIAVGRWVATFEFSLRAICKFSAKNVLASQPLWPDD